MPTKDFLEGAKKVDDSQDFLANATAVRSGPAPATAKASAAPPSSWFDDLENDVRQGGKRTIVGSVLGRLQGRDNGYAGLESGVSPEAAHIMGSEIMGPIHAAQATSTIPQHPVRGVLGTIGGALETGTLPGMVMAGPEAGAAIDLVPSTKHAGSVLGEIAGHAQIEPVFANKMSDPLLRLYDLGQRGSTLPKAVNQLIKRTTTPSAPDMLYPEARDFSSKISELSADERMSLTPTMKAALKNLRSGLHDDIAQAAANVGHPEEYRAAVKEFAQASQLNDLTSRLGSAAWKTAKIGIPAALGYETLHRYLRPLIP